MRKRDHKIYSIGSNFFSFVSSMGIPLQGIKRGKSLLSLNRAGGSFPWVGNAEEKRR
jgi:hypothetical protein